MQKLTDDLAAPWFIELWALAPTPDKARRLRKSTVEWLLKQHRIRRVDTETALRTLREPAINVAEGVTEAASIHLRSLLARPRVVNREAGEKESMDRHHSQAYPPCVVLSSLTSLARGFGAVRTAANGSARHSPVIISAKVVLSVMPSGITPVSTYRQSAINSFMAIAPSASLQRTDAVAEPRGERAAGLIAQPKPGEPDQGCARTRVAGSADAPVAVHIIPCQGRPSLEVSGDYPTDEAIKRVLFDKD